MAKRRTANVNYHEAGSNASDPDILPIYHTEEVAVKAVKRCGYGANTNLNYIVYNSAKIGFKRKYWCDSYYAEDIKCNKTVRLSHKYTERGTDGLPIYRIDIADSDHDENCPTAENVKNKVKKEVMKEVIE